MRESIGLIALLAGGLLGGMTAVGAAADGRWPAERDVRNGEARVYAQRDAHHSRDESSRAYRDERLPNWAVGTFHGRNGANGNAETITIRPDGSAEVLTQGEPPKYGTFAGETLTVDARISKVQSARGGVVIDGAYYRR